VHGHLDAAAPDVTAGKEVAAGAQLGFVGDSGNPGFVSLYLEARVVRADIGDISKLGVKQLADASNSVPSDARNVLPLVAP
jgi:murein DD-endopeptidase MepM/ murein hydrolase activator NlpD